MPVGQLSFIVPRSMPSEFLLAGKSKSFLPAYVECRSAENGGCGSKNCVVEFRGECVSSFCEITRIQLREIQKGGKLLWECGLCN